MLNKEGTSRPIVLLHGALGALQQLDPLKKMLTSMGREVYSLNFSGHGGNPFSSHGFGIDEFAGDILSFLNENKLTRADIFGYSMGGYVAIWLAHRSPERVDKITTLGTKFDWDMASAQKEVAKMNADKIVEKIPAFARILETRHAPNDWRELLNKTKDMMLALGANPMITSELAKKLRHRVSILLGDLDDMADRSFSQTIASGFQNGSFQLMNNTPHPIEKVNTNELAALITN
jgi:pimeloyl-ACP methyl ester carboxylesterase